MRRAHPVLVDHGAGDVGDPLQVVGCPGGDAPEGELLGHPAGEQDLHVVDQLLAGLQVAVLLRQVQRVAQRLATRDDRDLLDLVDARQELGHQRVPGLVPGDHPLLVVGDHLARLQPGDDSLERVVEVRLRDEVAAVAAREDRRLVAQVGEVGAGQPRGVAAPRAPCRRPGPAVSTGCGREDPLPPAHVGWWDEHLAVEPARAQQRLVQLLQHVRGRHHDRRCRASRTRPSRPGAG